MWRSIANDPTGDRRWIGEDDDDNWQRLAAIFEWARWLDEGEGMVSSLPIRVDGTCNGIQHLSAMVLDEVGAASVNLIPSDKPNDIYQDVADKVTEELFNKMPDRYASFWLEVFDGKAKRDVTKRPVMILPYGGTKNAYFKYTLEWLKKNDPEKIILGLDREDRNKAITYLTDILWTSVSGTVTKAVEVMNWLKECAKVASKKGLPLWWRTPSGFYVRQFYAKMAGERINTNLDGQKIFLQDWRETKELDTASQARGIAPNFVHSMDASALMTCINIATDRGVESFTSIHDAYGTVCADMWELEASIRQAFIQTYQEPVLEDFLDACRQVAGHAEFPKLPEFGALNLEDVAHSLYFFA
jgi:DNA-directed RNA polymerase